MDIRIDDSCLDLRKHQILRFSNLRMRAAFA